MRNLILSDNSHEKADVYFETSDELLMILNIYGPIIDKVIYKGQELSNDILEKMKSNFDWKYLSPDTAYSLIDLVELPIELQHQMSLINNLLDQKLVHKRDTKNVLLSKYQKFGHSIVFRGFDKWNELNSDHVSDHVDGIKIFEIIRQATLASFHINNLNYDTAVALMNLKIEYIRFVETFTPFLVHIIPINKPDGGAMFTLFSIYQEGELVAKGYLGTYTFRSKTNFSNKRTSMKEKAYIGAKNENWPIFNEKTI